MGKRGVAPAPTSLKIVKGEKPSRINHNEPRPDPSEVPECPEWLSEEAVGVWDALVRPLHAKGLLTLWDVEAFTVFCEAVVHHRHACQAVAHTDILVKGALGNMVKNPALQIARDTAQTIRAFAQEFGLTPSARSGIQLPPRVEYDEARRLLS
jgi:P27 family predicted phage terminase small subunit